ncbi:ER-derived vesicles protein Erv29p [Trichomonascus vanleenenianus]|uniref:protein ERV29 n=1 Tax=Trichomonascus vanleenenianus TaxID=2268995 RepID=UPI003ECA8AC2
MSAEQRPAFTAPPTSSGDNPSMLASLKQRSEKLDQFIGQVGAPVKPYLPGLARFLIVSTFLEDALRLMSQWSEQVNYIWNVRHLPHFLAVLYLGLNIVCMLVGSFSVILKKKLIYGVGALMFVVVSQAIVYGLIFDFQFFFRNLSLIGGLLLAVSDAFVHDRRAVPGLPMIEDKDKAKYFQLTGRILLICLFIAYMITKRWTMIGGVFNVFGLIACISVVIGFQARVAASFLVVLLTVQNLLTNPYWQYAHQNPTRDFLRYEHFQTLSIVGGLILLVSAGAGRISIDEKKKIY